MTPSASDQPTQRAIRCVLMRGGTSRGPIFLAADLPSNPDRRNEILLRIMGSPDAGQIDGLGGGRTVTSKAAIVRQSPHAEADVDYLFAQVDIERKLVDTSPTCGNMLAAAGPYAIEEGLVAAEDPTTTVVIRDLNTGSLTDVIVQTPGGVVTYDGDCEIPGVPGTAAPIDLRFRNIVGSKTGALLPTGQPRELILGVDVTCIDVATPMVLIRAAEVGKTGMEDPADIDGDHQLLRLIEAIRREAGLRMGLGDVSGSVLPKVGLVSEALHGGDLSSRYLTPTRCHPTYAVSGSICVSSAMLVEGSVANDLAVIDLAQLPTLICLEHPAGTLEVNLDAVACHGRLHIRSAAVRRTARRLMSGQAYVPHGFSV